MGSFNVACSVSGISISSSDEIIYFPLEKNIYSHEFVSKNFLIYPWCYYSPITLPIIGFYDDYGGIEIKENDHIKFLNKEFGYNINNLIDNDGFDEMKPKPNNLNDILFDYKKIKSGMFILKEIYDLMTNFTIGEYGEYHNFYEYLNDEYNIYQEAIKYTDKMMESCDQKTKDIFQYHPIIKDNKWSSFELSYHETMRKIYFDCFRIGQFKEEFIKFRTFEWSMLSMNKFYSPAMNGEQCGNHYAEKLLLEKSLEIVNKKIKEVEEND